MKVKATSSAQKNNASSTSFKSYKARRSTRKAAGNSIHPTGQVLSTAANSSFVLRPEYKQKLHAEALSRNVSMSQIIREGIDEYFNGAERRKAAAAQRAEEIRELNALRARVAELEALAATVRDRAVKIREANQAMDMFVKAAEFSA